MRQKNQVRVLFIADLGGNSTSIYYLTNLLHMGHRVFPYDPNIFNLQRLSDRLYLKITKKPPRHRLDEVSADLRSICKQNHFDLIFVMGQNFIPSDLLSEMKTDLAPNAKIVFHSHDNLFSEGILTPDDLPRFINRFDHVFTTKSQNVAKYRELGQPNSHYIPSAYEPTIHRPIPASESKLGGMFFPVTFVGRFDYSRIPFINSIGWEKLRVFGGGWERYVNFKQNRNFIKPEVHGDAYADVVSRSACVLGLLREEAEDRHTQRTFEIPACGGLQFAPRNEEIQTFFTEGKEIILFDTPGDLVEKINYYLRNENERKRLAAAGLKRLQKEKHTYADRLDTILEVALGIRLPRLKRA